MDASPDTQPYEVTVQLKREGLTHAKGKSDGCDGGHEVTIDLLLENLHKDGDCLTEEVLASLQKLHETAHPRGTVSVLVCWERECADLVEELTKGQD